MVVVVGPDVVVVVVVENGGEVGNCGVVDVVVAGILVVTFAVVPTVAQVPLLHMPLGQIRPQRPQFSGSV